MPYRPENPASPTAYEPYFQLPLAYSLPHEWGHFAVSRAAYEAYELLPLTANVVKGDFNRTGLEPDAVEILLLGPDEWPDWSSINIQAPPGEGATSRLIISKPLSTGSKGMQILGSLERTRPAMLNAEVAKYAQQASITAEQLSTAFVDSDGIPAPEAIGHKITTTLVHHLYPTLQRALYEGFAERRQRTVFRRLPFGAVRDAKAAKSIADDVHNDLCPDYFDLQFSRRQ